jgi:transketolase
MKSLSGEQRDIRRRILEISYKFHLSHLGSCFSAVDLIDVVYKVKTPEEKFILSNGHAGIALYAVLEKYGYIKDSNFFQNLLIHPDRNPELGIYVSTGSLGQGLPISLGMAIADKTKNVYCMISDGECAEGSIWEALRIASEKSVFNLKIILNANGWGAYGNIQLNGLKRMIQSFDCTFIEVDGYDIDEIAESLKKQSEEKPLIVFAKTNVSQFEFLKDQDAHYYIMNDTDYLNALDSLLWS